MSKAFTREDAGSDLPELVRPVSALPAGAVNYMTADGAERLRQDLARLIETERPQIAGKSKNAEAAEKLALIDQQIFQLEQSLQSAHVITHPVGPDRKSVV